MKRIPTLLMSLLFPVILIHVYAGKEKGLYSNPTDYFRSAASGDWANVSTWESSPDNISWAAATLVPTSTASVISIRNTHTVTVSSNEDMDEVLVESGAILFHTAGILNVNNGPGDDINVLGGGIFTLASNNNGPQFNGGATAFISPNGMLRLSASGLTGAGTGVNASSYVYSDASVLEYTLTFTAFSTAGVTYFPNANASTIPVFRITGNVGGVGGGSNTVINGLFEVNGTVTFQNSGAKTFRNGITGTGTISSDAASGKFIINGTTASLGGTGSLTLPTAGMDIGSNTTVTMLSSKTITGNIALLANALVMLGAYHLVMNGDISGGSATSHIVTNGTGKLVLNNIAAAFRTFPIGGNTSTINPLIIYNGSGLNYGARVEIGINPAIAVPLSAVNRTWVVNPSGVPAGAVNVNFFYSAGHGNLFFSYLTNVEQGFYTGVWNVINTGLVQAGSYQVATTVNSFAANTDAPMVLGNLGAILSVNQTVQLLVQKQRERIVLDWTTSGNNVGPFSIERSADGRRYSPLAELPGANHTFTDVRPLPGMNYYRVKMTQPGGESIYSNTVPVLNAADGFELISISPNPVTASTFRLTISAAKQMKAELLITDVQGRLVQQQSLVLPAGYHQLPVHAHALSAGSYRLYVYAEGEGRRVLGFVVR